MDDQTRRTYQWKVGIWVAEALPSEARRSCLCLLWSCELGLGEGGREMVSQM